MPSAIIDFNDDQVQVLIERFGRWRLQVGLSRALRRLQNEMGIAETDDRDDGEGLLFDYSGELSRFTHRCVGTLLELDAHQAAGGAILLAYPDGSVREIAIDVENDGLTIPRVASWRRTIRRNWRRRGSGATRKEF